MEPQRLSSDAAERAAQRSVVGFEVTRDLITIVGPDAAGYLQGQVSQDVESLGVGDGAWSFVLQPQGKVDGWFRVTRTSEDGFELDLDPGYGEAVLARLSRFMLRTKAELTLGSAPMLALRGPESVLPEGALARPLVRPDQHGFDLLGEDAGLVQNVPLGTNDVLETLRIRAGVPAMGTELTEKTIPAEAGVVDESVSFTKGCYVGQELVARIDSRGNNTPRNLFGVVVVQPGLDLTGAEVSVDGKMVGIVTSSATSAELGSVGLAYVQRGAGVPGEALVETSVGESMAARVEALPF